MKQRFYYDEFLEEIYDSSIDDYPNNLTIYGILNDQQQRIAELEEQLKNVPKYNVYSKVFFVDDCEKTIKEDFVEQITINHRDGILYELINNFLFEESELFATKEEAQAKLKRINCKNV